MLPLKLLSTASSHLALWLSLKKKNFRTNKSHISYLKTGRALDVLIHSRALLSAKLCRHHE